MAALLKANGVSGSEVWLEDQATDTFDSVVFCNDFLRARGYAGPVWVCSSRYHLSRCALLMRMLGWKVYCLRALEERRERGDHDYVSRVYWRLREIPAILWDGFLMLRHRSCLR